MPGVQFNKFELNFVKGKVKVNPGTISLLGYYRVTYMVVEKSFVDIRLTVPFQYRVTHLLAEKVMLTSVPSQDNLGMSRN